MADHPADEPAATLSDDELWGAFAAGDDEPIGVLLTRYRDELYWYLLISLGKEDAAAHSLRDVWALLAAYRRPFSGFSSFRAWLYAAATQSAVPPAHPEVMGLGEFLDDLKRVPQSTRRGKLFYAVRDLKRRLRQPFLLVTLAG
ncbi:MAG: RNA polymerase sigma factor, partial [Planctomycetota bacterium]